MTSARARADRVENDAYYTPDDLARVLVGLLPIANANRVIEPSVGGGAFVRAIREHAPRAMVVGFDVNPDAPGLAICDGAAVGDWSTIAETVWPADWIVGNPPYTHAEAHVASALAVGGGVAMLLRLAFLEGGKRFSWWRANGHRLHAVYVLAERPSFTGGSTDSAAYGWFVWGPAPREGGPTIDVLSWRNGASLALRRAA